MKKRRAVTVFGFIIELTVFVAFYGLVRAETVTLKAVTAWPKTASEYKAFATFTDLVEQMVAKRYPGELKIQFIGGPEAVKTPDQVQALQRGMVDMVFTTSAYYVSVLPEVDALKLSNFTPSEERKSGGMGLCERPYRKKDKDLLPGETWPGHKISPLP